MTLGTRRIVYSLFITAFIILAPLIILYTKGYRYNPKHQRLDSTGTLVVSSIPKGAAIILNGQSSKFTTPKTLQAVKPDVYSIKLSKNGYHDWEKHLPIRAGEALFISNIHLWRDDTPKKIFDITYRLAAPNREGSSLLLTSFGDKSEKIYLFDALSNGSPVLLTKIKVDAPFQEIIWSPNLERALFVGPQESAILDMYSPAPVWLSVSSLAPKKLLDFKWSDDSNVIYGRDDMFVYQIDPATKSANAISSSAAAKSLEILTDYMIQNNILFELWRRPNNPSILRLVSLLDRRQLNQFNLPTNQTYKFSAQNDDLIALKDSENRMTLWRLTDQSLLPIIKTEGLTQSMFSETTGDLLYATPFELWTYNPKTGAQNLLTRIAKTIKKVAWYPDGSHVAFVSDNAIYIIERDERDIRNKWTLVQMDMLDYYFFSGNGKDIYIIGAIDQKSGLWRLTIQ